MGSTRRFKSRRSQSSISSNSDVFACEAAGEGHSRFGSGVQGHQAMVKFEKRRQIDDESIDIFSDDL